MKPAYLKPRYRSTQRKVQNPNCDWKQFSATQNVCLIRHEAFFSGKGSIGKVSLKCLEWIFQKVESCEINHILFRKIEKCVGTNTVQRKRYF